MIPPATVTVGPSPLRIFAGIAIASVAITVGLTIVVAFLELLAAVGLLGFLPVPIWLWSHRWVIVACMAAVLACYCGIAVLVTAMTGRPRLEIGADGFVDYGIVGRRSRRWSDITGSFTVIRVGWPIGLGMRRVVAYRLTDACKESARIKPIGSLGENDEAILICPELTMGATELADLLNRWKQGVPGPTPSA
ncbi:MAG TPA: hypothetical protein VH475_25415 [Tepidisphaeraceae bacterium]|jgi:hypothetical protein